MITKNCFHIEFSVLKQSSNASIMSYFKSLLVNEAMNEILIFIIANIRENW